MQAFTNQLRPLAARAVLGDDDVVEVMQGIERGKTSASGRQYTVGSADKVADPGGVVLFLDVTPLQARAQWPQRLLRPGAMTCSASR